jgi:hypothetical protein
VKKSHGVLGLLLALFLQVGGKHTTPLPAGRLLLLLFSWVSLAFEDSGFFWVQQITITLVLFESLLKENWAANT